MRGVGGKNKEGCRVMGAETLLGRVACGRGVCPPADNHARVHRHAEIAAIGTASGATGRTHSEGSMLDVNVHWQENHWNRLLTHTTVV